MKNHLFKTKIIFLACFFVLFLAELYLTKNSSKTGKTTLPLSFNSPFSHRVNILFVEKEPSKVTAETAILTYHYVEEIKDKTDTARLGLTITPYFFKSQMEFLAKNGFTTITLGDLAENFYFGKKLPPKPIIITFDDGYEDFYHNVFPVLKKYNFSAVNFLIGNAINKQGYLTGKQVQEMLASGLVEIGAHTLSHIDLTQIGKPIAKKEIVLSKRLLEEKFGIPVKYFSYPYGSFNEEIEDLVKTAGYQLAVTTTRGISHGKSPLFRLPRLGVANLGDERFRKLLRERN